ncbi:MAG: hypothetical protein NT007_13830 [Candidatus Kapabacteria bacterium]|nr:hypothetical protein [Candidatus Kapabacteria bacterium]
MLTKESVDTTMEQMSETFSIDELIDKLIFVEKVNNGLNQSEQDMVLSSEEVKEELSRWLK